jgi:hypothetical protein
MLFNSCLFYVATPYIFKSATRLKITYATVAGLLPRGPGFAPGSVYVGFEVGELALGQVSLRVL